MLNPHAYRAALLEQLTSAADTSPEPVQVAVNDAPTSSLRLRPAPSTETPGAVVVEDDVVLKGRDNRQEPQRRSADSYTAPLTDVQQQQQQQQQQDAQPLYTIGHGYAVEQESNRSLILSFIDNCIRAGVPEDAIAEQVQFMVSSMKESLALHAALHAQRHRERIREYELGALTNMVERQQLQLEEQQHQQHQAAAMSGVGYDYAPLQLAPPPPLVYAGQTSPLHTHKVTKHAHTRAPPLRHAPSPPPPPTSAESSPPDFAAPVPISAWHRASVASPEQQQQQQQQQPPFVQLLPIARQAGEVEAQGDEKPPTARPTKEHRRVSRTQSTAATATRTHALHHRDHKQQHHHHRSHHALCAVCLRNAQDEEAAAEAGMKRSFLLSTPTPRRAGEVAHTTQQQQTRRLSPTASRHRYTPNGHYMKPTHASLVRRASSTSPLRHNAASNSSTAQSRRRSSPLQRDTPSQQQQQRRLVVRSTHSSRLRATASRPPPPPAEGSTGVGSTASADDSENGKGSGSEYLRANRSRSCYSSSSSSSVASTSTDDRGKRRSKMKGAHPARRETRRRDAAQNTRAASLDLYTSDTPPHASLRPRVTHAAQTDGWATSHTAAAPPPPPSSHTARLSIDPEPASIITAAETQPRATEHVGIDASSGSMPEQWRERRPAPEEPAPVTHHHVGAVAKGSDQQRQDAPQRPSRNAPRPNAAPGNATSSSSPPPPARHAVTTVVVMDQNDDDDAGSPVCVTSPQLQCFIEASQRKVRETDRLLGGTSQSTTAPSVTWHQHQVQRAPRSADAPVSLHVRSPPANRSDWKITSSVLSSPYVASSKTLWSDSSGSAAREKQLRRLHELRDRLRDYDTPVADGGAAGPAAVRSKGETTFASAWTSSSASAALSPDVRFRPHLTAAAAASQDKSPLIEISPTSSDEDNSRV